MPSSATIAHVTGQRGRDTDEPPVAELKSLTKKLSPPRVRLRPFMKPPCVDVAICDVAAGHRHRTGLDADAAAGGKGDLAERERGP